MKKGLVFDIDRFATHDGPGIRAAVFLKGCPLSCKWCHSPESQKNEPEVIFQESRCAKCEKCGGADLCVTQALRMCGRWYGADEIWEIVVRDKPFYINSGGGITISGGEPLMQADFTHEVLSLCRQDGIHTAMETSGFGNQAALLKIAEVCDLIYYDIKAVDDGLHQMYTGLGNAVVWDNLSALCVNNAEKIVVRVPCIPQVNDSKEQIAEIAHRIRLLGIRTMELMPYNPYAGAKYEWLGRDYELAHMEARKPAYYENLAEMSNEILRGVN